MTLNTLIHTKYNHSHRWTNCFAHNCLAPYRMGLSRLTVHYTGTVCTYAPSAEPTKVIRNRCPFNSNGWGQGIPAWWILKAEKYGKERPVSESESESMFAGIPQLKVKPWGSPSAGWDGSVCSHFPTAVHVCHTYMCGVSHQSGSCTLTSGTESMWCDL